MAAVETAELVVSSALAVPFVPDHSASAGLVSVERGVEYLQEFAAHAVNHTSVRTLGATVRIGGDVPWALESLMVVLVSAVVVP